MKPRRKLIGLIMGFGAGTLISAVVYDLVEDAAASGRASLLTAFPNHLITARRWWLAVAATSAVAAAIGYAFAAAMSLDGVFAQAFAAGALLTLLADSMLPEAHENGGNAVGLLTLLGFTVAFALSQIT